MAGTSPSTTASWRTLATRSDLNPGHRPWGENDALFRSEATEGHKWATFVADQLSTSGVPSTATPLEFAADVADRDRFVNEQDVTFVHQSGFIEVKSRRLTFSGDPKSYPYRTAFVDTVTGWDKKQPKPLAVVLVSQVTSALLVIPVSTSPKWKAVSSFDRVRQINERWYTVESSLLRPFSSFVEWMDRRAASY